RSKRDWSSDVCSSDLNLQGAAAADACFFANIRRDDDAPLGIHVSYHGNTHKNRPFSFCLNRKRSGVSASFPAWLYRVFYAAYGRSEERRVGKEGGCAG